MNILTSIGGIDITKSVENSPIINFVKSIQHKDMERFFDELLDDEKLLCLMTSSLNDLGVGEKDLPIILFSSTEKIKDTLRYLEEHSKQCKYLIPKSIRNIDIHNMFSLTLNNMSENEQIPYIEALFRINEFYGQSMYFQVKEGLDRIEKIIGTIQMDEKSYNKTIEKLLLLKMGNVMSYICWCSHGSPGVSPYAIYLQGNNLTADIKCPICGKDLHKMKMVILCPKLYPLMRNWGGILPALIGWYLTKSNRQWAADVKIDEHEYGDIIIETNGNYFLFECKIHDRDKNEKGIKEVIKKDLNQLFKHFNFWKEKGVNITKAVVFTNFLLDDKFKRAKERALREVDSSIKKGIDDSLIDIYPLMDITHIIEKIIKEPESMHAPSKKEQGEKDEIQ